MERGGLNSIRAGESARHERFRYALSGKYIARAMLLSKIAETL